MDTKTDTSTDTNTEIDIWSGASHGLPTTLLSSINRPGVYVTERGDVLRVASAFMAGGRIPTLSRDIRATRLSEDPLEPVSECRRVASSAGLPFNF